MFPNLWQPDLFVHSPKWHKLSRENPLENQFHLHRLIVVSFLLFCLGATWSSSSAFLSLHITTCILTMKERTIKSWMKPRVSFVFYDCFLFFWRSVFFVLGAWFLVPWFMLLLRLGLLIRLRFRLSRCQHKDLVSFPENGLLWTVGVHVGQQAVLGLAAIESQRKNVLDYLRPD